MAKFRRSNDSVCKIGSNTLTCVIDVSYDERADVYVSDCDDANLKKEQVSGGIVRSGTMTAEVNVNDETQLGYVDIGQTGTWTDQPNGTTAGDIKWTATAVTVVGRRFVSSRTNLATYEIDLIFAGLDHSAN